MHSDIVEYSEDEIKEAKLNYLNTLEHNKLEGIKMVIDSFKEYNPLDESFYDKDHYNPSEGITRYAFFQKGLEYKKYNNMLKSLEKYRPSNNTIEDKNIDLNNISNNSFYSNFSETCYENKYDLVFYIPDDSIKLAINDSINYDYSYYNSNNNILDMLNNSNSNKTNIIIDKSNLHVKDNLYNDNKVKINDEEAVESLNSSIVNNYKIAKNIFPYKIASFRESASIINNIINQCYVKLYLDSSTKNLIKLIDTNFNNEIVFLNYINVDYKNNNLPDELNLGNDYVKLKLKDYITKNDLLLRSKILMHQRKGKFYKIFECIAQRAAYVKNFIESKKKIKKSSINLFKNLFKSKLLSKNNLENKITSSFSFPSLNINNLNINNQYFKEKLKEVKKFNCYNNEEFLKEYKEMERKLFVNKNKKLNYRTGNKNIFTSSVNHRQNLNSSSSQLNTSILNTGKKNINSISILSNNYNNNNNINQTTNKLKKNEEINIGKLKNYLKKEMEKKEQKDKEEEKALVLGSLYESVKVVIQKDEEDRLLSNELYKENNNNNNNNNNNIYTTDLDSHGSYLNKDKDSINSSSKRSNSNSLNKKEKSILKSYKKELKCSKEFKDTNNNLKIITPITKVNIKGLKLYINDKINKENYEQ